MLPEMGPPETTTWEYPMADNSWDAEFAEFLEDIRLKRPPSAGLRDAIEALPIIEKIYRMSGYDHHAYPAPHQSRRRWHRSALLLPRARRLPDRGSHQQVRLRQRHAAVHAGHLSQVFTS